jgi:hypothetical protein
MLICSFTLFPLLAQTVLAIGSIRQKDLANQAFDNGLEQRQLQVPLASKGPRKLQSSCKSIDGWELVAHMSNVGGMFDGDSNFDPAYSYTTNPFVAKPNAATPDFYRPFPIANVGQIKFSTGDGYVSAITDYSTLKALIDAKEGDGNSNIDFTLIEDGALSKVRGNVLSRLEYPLVDPKITYAPKYPTGAEEEKMLWAEQDGIIPDLKNAHGGMNVYINECFDPLDNLGSFSLGSFSEDYASLIARDDGSYSLTTRYTPVTTTASRKIQIYSNNVNTVLGSAASSCPSVNKDAKKVGDIIDQARIDAQSGFTFIQATGLEIITANIDLGASPSGTIFFPFAFRSGFGTFGTSDFYLGTVDGVARYQFCVRQILQLDSGEVVDVMEVPLDFTFTLDGTFVLTTDFEVKTVSVAGETKEDATSYGVDIYQCNFPTNPTVAIAPVYSQGDIVELCIRSRNFPLASVVNILSLEFAVANIVGAIVTYEAIGSALTDFEASTDCDTFVNGAGVTEQICGIRVLLPINIFFAAGTGFEPRKVAVFVTGTSLLATVGGSLGRRELQESDKQEASFSMSLATVGPENSGGFSMMVALATGVITVAIAALLI